jgi:hypothetical protein
VTRTAPLSCMHEGQTCLRTALLPPQMTLSLQPTHCDPAQHAVLLRTICMVLARTPVMRMQLVAVLHTGGYMLP